MEYASKGVAGAGLGTSINCIKKHKVINTFKRKLKIIKKTVDNQ